MLPEQNRTLDVLGERHLEWDIVFLLEEASSLLRAEVVIHNSINDPSIPIEKREKRSPFLQIAFAIVKAERTKRLLVIRDKLNELLMGENSGKEAQEGEANRATVQGTEVSAQELPASH